MPSDIMLFQNKDELLVKAREQADKVDATYQQSVFLYFIARYFVSLYEGRFGEIPIQVWNEYRNSLDHFFRNLTNSDNGHLGKMEGHLQRASLDIMKIYCHKAQTRTISERDAFKVEVLQLVDNGHFYTSLIIGLKEAEELFVNAKIDDSSLGDDAHTNQEILGRYLDSVFAFDEVYNSLLNKAVEIESAQNTYTAIHNDAAKGTFWEHMHTHYIFYISWTLIVGSIQYVYNTGWQGTINKISSFFSF